jgi:hypothetical protein
MPFDSSIDRLALILLGAGALVALPARPAEAQVDTAPPTVVTVANPRRTSLAVSVVSTPPTPVTRSAIRLVNPPATERAGNMEDQPAAPHQAAVGAIDRPHLATGAYYAFLGGAVAANAVGHFIDDPGGYPRQWDQWTVFHLIGGWGLDALGEKLAVPVTYKRIPVRPLAVCTAIVAWEHAKGYADWRDMTAGCTGAMVSAGSTWLFRALF